MYTCEPRSGIKSNLKIVCASKCPQIRTAARRVILEMVLLNKVTSRRSVDLLSSASSAPLINLVVLLNVTRRHSGLKNLRKKDNTSGAITCHNTSCVCPSEGRLSKAGMKATSGKSEGSKCCNDRHDDQESSMQWRIWHIAQQVNNASKAANAGIQAW